MRDDENGKVGFRWQRVKTSVRKNGRRNLENEEINDAAEEETVEEAEEAAAEEPEAGKEKGSFFKKKERKDKKDEKIEELTDRVRRQMAEFDNFRKRTEKEKTQMFETGAKSIVEKNTSGC